METKDKKDGARIAAYRRRPEDIHALPGRELEEKRTEMGKFYALGENLYQLVLSGEAVHYRHKQTGKWVEIDNTLEAKPDKGGRVGLENRGNGCLKVALMPTDADWMVRLENAEGQTLAWRLETKDDKATGRGGFVQPFVRAHIKARGTGIPVRAEAALTQASSEAAYEEILPGADMRCRIEGTTFKEDVVFKTREVAGPVSFEVEAKGLALRLLQDQSAQALDDSCRQAFALPAPHMEDSEGNAGSVTVTLTELGDGRWRLTYTPDEKFLSRAVYPVILDPTVKTTDHSTTALKKNLVKSATPETVFAGVATATVEEGQNGAPKSIGFYKFEQAYLPPIDSSYYVMDATLTLTSSNRTPTLYLNEVLEDWSAETLTYANKPAMQEMCADALVSGGANTMNITNLVRRWYEGANYGFAVQVKSEGSAVSTNVSNPTLTISYVSLAGLAEHLSYESHSVGRTGTAHVGLFNGDLVVEHVDTVSAGVRMPVSVGHTYNACYHDLDLYKAGKGWRHSLLITLHRETLKGDATPYYVLTDGTGTRHHFKLRSGTVYDDLSGLYLTLTVTGNKAVIEDKGNNQMEFDLPTVDSDGRDEKYKLIKLLKNAQGDQITVTATEDGLSVQEVTDGIGRATRFEYDESGMLCAIYSPGHEETGVHFDYDEEGRLVRILHENDTEALYSYDDTGRLAVLDNYGRKLSIAYHTSGPRRVASVREHHDTMEGNLRLYAYGDGQTIVTDGTVAEGKRLVYHFSDYGNVVSCNDMLGQASFTKYSGTVPLHRPEIVSKTQRSVSNLLKNHSFEENDGWELYCTAKMVEGGARLGTRCLRFENPAHGGFQYAAQDVKVVRAKIYTLSLYAKKSGDMALWATCQYQNELSRWITLKSPPLEDDLSNEYSRCSFTFALPENAASDTVKLFICAKGEYGDTATIWVDTVQLEEGDVANQYNLLRNTDFSRAHANGTPEDWTSNASNDASKDLVQIAQQDPSKPDNVSVHAMRLYGAGAKAAGIYQEMSISGKKDDVFVAGGWSKGYSVPRGGTKKKYNLRIAFKQGASFVDYPGEIEFSEEWSGWRFACGPIIAPADYTAVRFHIDYEKNQNHADFTSMFLYKEEFGWTYTYDAQGNVISVKDLTGKYKKATYDAYNNLTEYVPVGQPDTVKVKMEYGATDVEKKRHLVRKSTSPLGVVQTYEYDSAGNQTLVQMVGAGTGGQPFMQSEAHYTADKNHSLASFDAKGSMAIRQRDPKTDHLTYAGSDSGASVLYSYDEKDRLAGAHMATADQTVRNQYEYNDQTGELTRVKHNTTRENEYDVAYEFVYDALGNRTETKVGDRLLARTVYTETGDKLPIRQEFGNGGAIHLERDEFKRLRSMRMDDDEAPRYTYSYDASGHVAKLEDHALGRTLLTDRDLGYRPVRYREREGDRNIYRQSVEYDACNRISKRKEAVGEAFAKYETAYAYDVENKPTEITLGNQGMKLTLTYDALGRVTSQALKRGSEAYTTGYVYQPGVYGDGSATAAVEKINQQDHMYEYTQKGMLTAERRNGVKTTYEYDSLGQLKRVNDAGRQKSFTYTYDRGGNLLRKAEYAYAALGRMLGEAEKTIEYAYGDEGWKDKLTAYDGTPIQSDAIGNVVEDGTWRYSWQIGRQLARMESAGDTVRYTYNADGLRVRKESESRGVTEYTLYGGQVVHLTRGTQDLHFWYGVGSGPVMVTYNGKDYGYVYNLQGDVVGLMDVADGFTDAVTYSYDAWGKPTACTGPMAETLGRENPFRYRGYVYDEETGLYYLRSRYYNPEWGRFVNADSVMTRNIFAYCSGNPVSKMDSSGCYDEDVPTNTFNLSAAIKSMRATKVYYSASRYSPEKAADYSDKWAESYNPEFYKYNNDCTNFVSQSLVAGGLKKDDDFHSIRIGPIHTITSWASNNLKYAWFVTKAWRSAQDLERYLLGSGHVATAVTLKSPDDIPAVLGMELAGYPAFFNDQAGTPTDHAMMISAVTPNMIEYNAHSNPRHGDPLTNFWQANPEGIVTIYILR